MSKKWKSLSFASLAAVVLSPKDEIATPSSIKYTMTCIGSGVPTGANSTPMQLKWKDNSLSIQTSSTITLPATLINSASGSISLIINNKRFRTEGFKSLYSFRVTASTQQLNQDTRLYFDFHKNLNSKLDSEGVVECYTRLTSTINDTEAIFTYCEFNSDWQLVVWNNRIIAANLPFYVDIYNVEQPKFADIGANQVITLSVDLDDSIANGIYGFA